MLAFVYISHGFNNRDPLLSWVLGITIGLLLLVILASLAGHTSLEISPDNRYYRTYFGLLGLRLGRWQPLPPVVGVTLKFFSARGSGPAPSTGSWSTWDTSDIRYQKLVLLLSLHGSGTGLVINRFSADEVAQARAAATAAAARFGVPVREYLLGVRTRR